MLDVRRYRSQVGIGSHIRHIGFRTVHMRPGLDTDVGILFQSEASYKLTRLSDSRSGLLLHTTKVCVEVRGTGVRYDEVIRRVEPLEFRVERLTRRNFSGRNG